MSTITDRIDAVTKIPAAYLAARPPAPKSVKIELTGRCNYRCGFCALRTRAEQPRVDMDMGFFRRITREMKVAGVKEIGCFYLGESFMTPVFLADCIRWVKKELGFEYVFLTTNGSLATPEHVWAVMDAGLDSLKFSINACDPEQFAKVMGVKPALYEKALKNLKQAKKIRDANGYKCGVYASSIRYDGEQQTKMEALLADRVIPYVDQHYWLPLYSMGAAATQREAELGYRPTAGNQGRLDALRAPLPCWSAFTEGHVTASGSLSACCFDADARWSMADLNLDDFMTGWHSATFAALREAHIRKDVSGTVCEKCVAYQ
jgi:MoaA/NifB/PqqE/SkfB family radical SAM enzyme